MKKPQLFWCNTCNIEMSKEEYEKEQDCPSCIVYWKKTISELILLAGVDYEDSGVSSENKS